jgi:hypothetical protein
MKPIYERLGFKKPAWDSFKKEARVILVRVVLPLPLAGRLARPFASRAGAEFLVKGGFRIGCEPLVAAGTNFTGMLLLHPAFSTAPFLDRYASFGPIANHAFASFGCTSSR